MLQCFTVSFKSMIYSLLQYGLMTALCFYLVNYYSSKQVSTHVKVWSVITWTLNFGLALLVPQDVYQTLKQNPDPRAQHNLGVQYLLLYWSVYILTWTVIPVLQEWEDAGDLKSQDRLKRSLRTNGYFYLVLLGISVLFLVVILILGVARQMGLIIFLKCLASMWGMLLLMVFLGYSLVEIPKTLWHHSDVDKYLHYLYGKVYELEQQVEEAKREFKRVVAYVHYVRKNSKDQKILQYCSASEGMIPVNLKPLINASYQRVVTNTDYLTAYPICLQSSIQHNRLMKRAIARIRRQEKALSLYVIEAIFFQDVSEAAQQDRPLKSHAKKTSALFSYWYVHLRPVGHRVIACLIGCFSVIILISQTQVFLSADSSLLGYCLLFKSYQVVRVLVFVVMGFMVYMSNYGLFRLKLANVYGLYKKESDGASLMFATVNFSRIGVAIVLNFLDMMKMDNNIFDHVMQTPQMGMLGSWVLRGLPGILWLIALSHYFNFWGWAAKKLGVEDEYSFQSHDLKGQEGQNSMSKPVLVVSKRGQLQQRNEDNYFEQELSNL